MVEMRVNIDGATSAAFDDALKLMADSMGAASSKAPQRAAIWLCKSFRAGTRVAKQNRAMVAGISSDGPAYITYKDGKKLDRPLRRWKVTLSDRGKTFTRYVYAGSQSEMRKQLRDQVGTNYYPLTHSGGKSRSGGTRGLAKQSWGWVMHNIFSGAAPDTPWSRRRGDRRNPKDATKDSYSRQASGATSSGGVARICNRIDYIGDTLKESMSAYVSKTVSKIVTSINLKQLRSGGASPSEIKSAAKQMLSDFLSAYK